MGDRRERTGYRGKFRHAGIDRQIGLVDPPQLFRSGMHVDQLLLRPWRLDQGIAAGGHLSQAGTDRQEKVCLPDPLRQRRVDADPHIADVIGVAVVEQVLTAE